MLTKKNFEAIAKILKEANEDYQGGTPTDLILSTIEVQLMEYFTKDNPRFDRERFRKACDIY